MNNKILVVDDDKAINELIKVNLELVGYTVVQAYDGIEGFAVAKQELPSLIILDVMMPYVNGYKVSRMLKFDSRYKDIPILMLTARSQESDKELGEETGANEYITKPFDINFVMERVKAYLG